MNTKYLIGLLMAIFLLGSVVESDAQRRSSRSKRSSKSSKSSNSDRSSDRGDREDAVPFKDKLAYDIYLGTVGFGGGVTIGTKFGIGYKVLDPLTVGLGLKSLYAFTNRFGTDDFSQFNYGYYPYVRYRIAEQFYAKAEYDFYTFDTGQANADKINFNFPMIGGGYLQGFGKWKFGIELMLMLGDDVVPNTPFGNVEKSDLYTLIDYNISFLYNF